MPKKSPRRSPKKQTSAGKTLFFNLLNKVIGLALLVLGLVVLLGYNPFYKPVQNSNDPIKISQKLVSQNSIQEIPLRVIIPNVKIDDSIVEAKIINGYWELSENTASYGQGSGIPGKPGNTVIFAHAREGLFYNLKDVKKGDLIYTLTKNKWYKYKINKITAVYPNQTQVIMPTKTETLTLYTCTGFYDEKRLIVTALPVK